MSSPPPSAQDRNWALVAGHAILVVHAISRHKALFVLTWAAVVGMSLAAVAALPKAYDVETTIQVSPTELISGAAQRPGTSSSTSGTYAYETVLSRQALIDLIRQTDLMEKWPKTRGPVLTLKDAIWGRIYRQPTPAEKLDIFVAILETRLWVKTEDTTITIGIRFPDPDLALRLVESAQTEFLEARQVQEIKTVEDAIQILEKGSRRQVDVGRCERRKDQARAEAGDEHQEALGAGRAARGLGRLDHHVPVLESGPGAVQLDAGRLEAVPKAVVVDVGVVELSLGIVDLGVLVLEWIEPVDVGGSDRGGALPETLERDLREETTLLQLGFQRSELPL